MRIAQIAPCWITVPPTGYGGTELVVAHLADGLVDLGHEVTLFASGGSVTKGKLVSYYKEPLGTAKLVSDPLAELPHVLNAYDHAAEFDLIHDHTFPVGPSIGSRLGRPPIAHTLHGLTADPRAREIYGLLGKRVNLISISDYQRHGAPHLNYVATVYNGIKVEDYPFRPNNEDYLLFLGRMSPQKGAHLAVEAATMLGKKLIIATKMVEPVEIEYFEAEVRPRMTDAVELIGEISIEEKARLYAGAICTLMPIQWPEPFGLVMAESMACGTPVVAYRNGSVPEIIDEGVTGFIASDLGEFVEKVKRVDEIDPAACREAVDERFSTRAMVEGYLAVYERLTA